MNRRLSRLVVLFLASILSGSTLSCPQQLEPNKGQSGADAGSFQAAAEAYEAVVAERDADRIDSWIDAEALIDRALLQTDLGDNDSSEYRTLFLEKVKFPWGRRLVESIGPKGSYKLVQFRLIDGENRAIYRLLNDSGMFNYHDVLFVRDDAKTIRIADIYIFSVGNYASATLAEGINSAPAASKTVEETRASTAEIGRGKQLAQLFREQKYAEAVDLYHSLIPELRQQKAMKMIWVAAAAHVGMEAHEKAVSDYRASFPNDPSLDLLLVDYFFTHERWEGVIDCLDRLNAIVKDVYLDALAAAPLLRLNRLDDAESRVRKAVTAEPTLEPAQWMLVEILLEKNDFDGVAARLAYIEQTLGIPIADLTGAPVFAKFVASDAYQRWFANRPIAAPSPTPESQPAVDQQ